MQLALTDYDRPISTCPWALAAAPGLQKPAMIPGAALFPRVALPAGRPLYIMV